jgi:hypothetical protein
MSWTGKHGSSEMTAEERIAALDERFVSIYEATRARLVDAQKTRALIVVIDDRMLLYHGGREPREITGLRPPRYEKLKSLNHVPLAIYCLLQDGIGCGPLPRSALEALEDYRRQLAASAADFDTTPDVESGLLAHRIEMCERALAFLDRVIADGRASRDALVDYCRANLADMNASFLAATKVQLDACHDIMMTLKEEVFSAEDWADLRVVIIGPRMAHKDQNFLQYFARLLHTPMYADRRVVYFEGDGEEVDQALDLLGTTMLDFRAARVIFADDSRLHRDVLADATKDYLDALLPPQRENRNG